MTANHEHTPTMDRIRDDFIEAWAGHFMDGEEGAAEYFDQALHLHNARIEAAAEQRGAERGKIEGLREAATIIRDSKFANSVKPPHEKVQVPEANWLERQADRLEGDGA